MSSSRNIKGNIERLEITSNRTGREPGSNGEKLKQGHVFKHEIIRSSCGLMIDTSECCKAISSPFSAGESKFSLPHYR